ncbi:MAG TPA: TrkA family potassium uptake protein [Phycisphaerales bacterium]|nr:TrkA family potassium uptake protein [Phycisphaerales bacterium]
MQTFAVIGLGRFGSRLAASLAASGNEVIAIDRDASIVEEIRDRVTVSIALDATDEQALRGHGIDKVDAAIVGIGNNFEATTLATVLLKQMGVRLVISRAASRVAGRVLARVGADEVVNPEDESADRWAQRLLNPQFLNQIGFHEGHSIVEVRTPRGWVGQSLAELDLRKRHRLHVVALRRAPEGGSGAERIELPSAQEALRASDVLVLMGRDEDLARLPGEGAAGAGRQA